MPDPRLRNIVIVLRGTKYSGNLGSVARAMCNMGIENLRLADPQCRIDEEALRMARRGRTILERSRRYRSLKSAVRGLRFLVGTTGKTGGYRGECSSPRALAPQLLDFASRQKVGLLFGPEDTGLTDEDLLLCQRLIRIPTHHRFRSMNLSHAVTVLCYELRLAPGDAAAPREQPELASVEQVEGMYSQLESALLEIGFLHEKNANHMMFAIRRLLGRAGLKDSDVSMLRGIARQIDWYKKNASANRDSD